MSEDIKHDHTPAECRMFQFSTWQEKNGKKLKETLVSEQISWDALVERAPQWRVWASSSTTHRNKCSVEFPLEPSNGIFRKRKIKRIA